MHVFNKFYTIVDRLISPEIKINDKQYTKAILLARFVLICLVASIFFLPVYYLIHLRLSFYSVLVSAFVFITVLLFLRTARDTIALSRIIIALCYFIITIIVIDTGGWRSPAVAVFTIVPIIGFLLGSKRDGYLFTFLTLLAVIILYLLPYWEFLLVNNLDERFENTHRLIFNLFAILFVLLMVLNYDKELTSSNEELQRALKKMKESEVVMQEISEQAVNFSRYLAEAEDELTIALSKEKEAGKKLLDTQAQLVQSEKMASVGQLTAGIAHEINNPVNFIQTGIAGLEQNLNDIKEFDAIMTSGVAKIKEGLTHINDPQGIINAEIRNIELYRKKLSYDDAYEEIEELFSSIKNGANRTAEIVEGLRTFSRLDENALKLTDLESNLDSTLALLKNKTKNRIEIVKNYGSIPSIECFPGKLNQVFMNLLVNAVQAIPHTGKITIATERMDDAHVRISISDTGVGIPKSLQDKIYDPFFTTKPVGEGTGLGLAITKGIIADHHAQLTFETEENKGTTFFITIPNVQPNKK